MVRGLGACLCGGPGAGEYLLVAWRSGLVGMDTMCHSIVSAGGVDGGPGEWSKRAGGSGGDIKLLELERELPNCAGQGSRSSVGGSGWCCTFILVPWSGLWRHSNDFPP